MEMKLLALKSIKSSPFNSRKTFDEVKMKELTASVEEKGILNPILVRPLGQSTTMGKDIKTIYELVCGERRMRAAVAAGLEEIPAVVRTLTDQQTLECMVIENLQREDVHPLEEAEGYEALLKKYGYKDVKDIAAKVGKSPTYIYGRLKLCELIPENRKLFYDGKLSASGALVLARVPAHLQKKAGQEIVRDEDDYPVPLSRVRRCVEREYMLQLKEAPFDPREKELAGKISCVACPKRTGSQPELFADIQGKDVCTDPACFSAKKSAFVQRAVENLRKQGHRVVSEGEAKQLFNCENDDSPSQKYFSAAYRDYGWPEGRTVESMLKKAMDVKPVFAIQPYSGKVIKMVAREDLPKIMKAAGLKVRSDGSKAPDLAAQKQTNRVELTRQIFWRQKLVGMKDRACLNVVLLFIALREMSYGSDEEFLAEIKSIKDGDWNTEKLFSLGDAKVKGLLDEAAVRRMQQIDVDDEDLEFLSTKLGFRMAKDYVITEPYLQACTKDQLVKLAKELNINIDTVEDKKTALVAFILKSAPKGKVPKELAK